MTDQSHSSITPGAYNDARISIKGSDIRVSQNPVMFIVLAVLALVIGAVLFFLAGSGKMTINNIAVPPAIAKWIGIAASAVLLLAAIACILQAMSPAMLILTPSQAVYKRTGGIMAVLAGRRPQSGSFTDFQKLTLEHGSGQNPSGQQNEWWCLALHWKDGKEYNLGTFTKQDQARQVASGFATELNIPLEEC